MKWFTTTGKDNLINTCSMGPICTSVLCGEGRGGKCQGLWSGCHIAHHHVLTAKGQMICMNRPRSGTVPKEG